MEIIDGVKHCEFNGTLLFLNIVQEDDFGYEFPWIDTKEDIPNECYYYLEHLLILEKENVK